MALKITQIRSASGATERQIKSLKGLRLGRIGKTFVAEDTPQIRGLIGKVQHLVKIEEVSR